MKTTGQESTFDFDAFVSYSHVDSERVTRLHRTLTEKFNLRIFLDEKNVEAGPLHEQCAEGIRRSKHLIIVCSRSSLKSEWVLAEHDMMRARDPRGQSIIPIILDESKLPLQIEALYRIDFRNHGDDGVNTAKLAALLTRSPHALQALEQPILIEHGSPSPFNTYGPIPLNSKCYVRRNSDFQLRHLLANSNSFAWIQGSYRMGKSSLLLRHEEWIPEGWSISRPKLELCSKTQFWKDFFTELHEKISPQLVQHEFNPAEKWLGLRNLALKSPVALILDEIGICDGSRGHELLRALLAIKEAAPTNFKCIASFKRFPQDYLAICKCDEPKLRDCWQAISLAPFTHNDAQGLGEILPLPISDLLNARASEIERVTGLLPHAVQQLLDKIWASFEGLPILSTAGIDSILDEQLASFSAA